MSRIETPDARLIELLRRSDAPSEDDSRRVRNAVSMKLAVGVGASTALMAVTHTSWAARLGMLGTWGKSVVLLSSLVGVGVGVTWYAAPSILRLDAPKVEQLQSTRSPKKPQPAAQASSAIVEPEASQVEDLAAELPATDHKARSTGRSPGRASGSTLEAELELLGRAQRALKSGQPNEALRALEEHARRFPSGVLTAERSGVRTIALCQAGRLEEGRTAARNYMRLVPNSVLSKRIRIACQLSGE